MKRTAIILVLGLACGLGVHFAYFQAFKPCTAGTIACQIEWMKDELHLSDEQFARIRQLHEASSPRLRQLAAEVLRLQNEFAEFERERSDEGQVDFIEFARYIDLRRAVDSDCAASTKGLVLASADVMTPEQRKHYLDMIHAD